MLLSTGTYFFAGRGFGLGIGRSLGIRISFSERMLGKDWRLEGVGLGAFDCPWVGRAPKELGCE